MSQIRVNNITNKTGIAGPTVAGIASVNSNSHFVVPTGRTGQRYADDGENIVRDGLVLYLDAKYSYPSKTGIGTTTSGAAATAGSSLEGEPYTWYDMSGYENHGQLTNGVGYNASNGGSLVFDGVDDYVSLGQSPSGIDFSSGSTISIWVKVLSNIGGLFANDTVLSKWWDGSIRGFNFGASSTAVSFSWRPQNTGTDLLISYTSGTSFINQWISVVVTNSSSQSNLYLNGNLVSSLNTISDSFIRNNNADLRVGRYTHTSLNGYSNSQIAQVSIYNRALSAAEVLQNYNATKSRFGL